MTIQLRGKKYVLYRRVPKQYASVDSRTFVKQSLHTDSLEIAKTKAPAIWPKLVDGWEAKLAGDGAGGERAFAAARRLAEARGVRYLGADAVAELPLEQLAERFEALKAVGKRSAPLDKAETAAVMGALQRRKSVSAGPWKCIGS